MFNFERSLRRLAQEVETRKRQEPKQARPRLELLEDRAVPANYLGAPTTAAFTDISSSGIAVITGSVDDTAESFSLGSNSFNFYGTSYSTAFVSSNGLITFGAGDTAFSNDNLSSRPQPTIAVYWDDLVIPSGQSVFAEIVGSQLIVQWNEVQGFASSPSSATFQAVLELNTGATPGSIQLNYSDIDFGNSRSDGGEATVGVADANQGLARQVYVQNGSGSMAGAGQGPFAGNGLTSGESYLLSWSTPSTVYVSPTWSTLTPGNFISDADFGTAVSEGALFGYDGFATLADAQAAVASGGTIIVNAGTYAETINLTGGVDLSVTGPALGQAVTISSLSSAAGSDIAIQGTSSLTIGAGNIAGIISGSGSLVKDTSGTLTLSGANTFTGTTTVNAGNLTLVGGAAIANSGAVTLAGTANLTLSASETIGSLSGVAGTTLSLGSNTLTTGGNNSSTTFSGVIGGTGGLIKQGSGTFTLGGANTYTGTTTINAGVLAISAIGNLGATPVSATANALTLNGGTLQVTASGVTFEANRGITLGSGNGTIDVRSANPNNFTIDSPVALTGKLSFNRGDGSGGATSNVAVNGVVSGGGSLFVDTPGGGRVLNVTLNASNTFTGGTTLGTTAQSGTNRLILGTDSALGTGTLTVVRGELQGTAPRTIANAVSFTGDNLTLGGSNAFTFNGNWTLNTANAKISTNVDATIAGNIGQTGGTRPLTKDGPSTLLLSGTNTYAGTTTVTSGTLLVNGTNSGTGAVSVTGGVLGGTGSIAGVVTVNTGGSITGGTLGGTGNLTVGGLNFNGGQFKADVNGDVSDRITSAGTIDLNTGTAGTFTVNSATGSTSAANVFVFLNNTGSGAILDTFASIAEGSSSTVNSKAGFYSYVGSAGANDFIFAVSGAPTLSGNGNLEVRTISAGGSPTVQLLQGSSIVDSRPLASVVGTYTVNGGTGADTLTVNYSTTAPATGYFQRDIAFNGGTGSDTLIITGGSFGNITHNYTNANDGSIAYYSDAAGTTLLSTITYTGLSPIVDNSVVVNRVFNLPATASNAILEDDGTSGNGFSRLRSSPITFEQTDFTNPTGSLTITRGNAASTLTINALPDFSAPFTVGTLVAPFASTTIAGAVTVTGSSSIFANAIASNALLSVGANTLTLNAGTGAITDGNGAANNVTATSLVASATIGIDLDTTVTNLTATNSGAGNINLDEADGANVLNVAATNGNATVTSATGALNVTTVSASATVTLTATAGAVTDGNGAANNITATTALLTAGTSIATAADPLETTVANVTISAGSGAFVANTGALSVTSAAGGTGDLTVTSTAALTLAGNVSTSATARLSGTTVTQTGGTLTIGTLAARSTSTITLTQSANNVGTLAIASNGIIEFVDTNGFALGSAPVSGAFAATSGVNSTGNRITLTAGGAVTQTAGISGSSLQLLGSGSYTLTSQALNSVPLIAADLAGGSVNFETTGSLSVGTVNGTVGIATGVPANGGNVRLRSTTGLTVNEDINTQNGTGGVITIGGGVTLANDLVVGQGNIDLGGGGLDIEVTLPTSFNAPVVLAAPRDILVQANLTTTGATSDLTLRAGNGFSDNNAGGVRVYSGATVSSARDLTISGKDLFQSLNTNPADAVLINAGGAVTAARDLTIQFNAVGGWSPTTPVESRTILNGSVSDTGGNISIDALTRTELFGTVAGGTSGSVTFIAPVLLTGTSSVTNTGPITFQSTVDGANDLTVNASTGTTTFQAAVGGTAPIGDGAGAALTIAGGAATFNGTVTARSGLTQAGTAGLVTFNENVSINAISGATPSTFNGNVTLSSMTFRTNSAVAGQGNVTFGDAASDTVTLAGGPSGAVTLQTTGSVANTILSTATVVDTTNTLLVLSAAPSTSAINFTAANTYNGVTHLDVGRFNLTGSLTGAGGEVRLNGANVILNGGTTGIVEGAGRGVVANGTATSATVQNFRRIRNTALGGVGVRLAGGSSVRVIDNTGSGTADGISGSTFNVQTDGGTLFLRGNKINAASAGSSIGLDILGDALVDAGQDQGGYDFTGLGSGGVAGGSTGGNVFGESSSVGYTTTGFAIRNRSVDGLNGAAGPQGAPADTYAQGNTFNGTTALSLFAGSYIPIENVVSHDFDNATWGFVNYVTNGLARPARITDADGEILLFMATGTAQANNNWDQRSMIRYLRISFNDFVFFGSGATQLTRNGGTYDATGGTFSGNVGSGRTGPVVFNPNPLNSAGASNSRYFNYDFEATGTNAREVSGSLVDGAYTFALDEARIQAFVDFSTGDFPALQVGAGTQSLNFHRLFGDFNGDGVTNTTDRTAFNAAFRSTFRTLNYREYFDFDADRDVDGGDQTQFNRRLDRY